MSKCHFVKMTSDISESLIMHGDLKMKPTITSRFLRQSIPGPLLPPESLFRLPPSHLYGDGMLDFLALTSDTLIWEFLNNKCKKGQRIFSPKGYRQAFKYSYKDFQFKVFTGGYFSERPKCKVEMNPRKSPSFQAMLNLAHLLIGANNYGISRTDVSLLLNRLYFPVELFRLITHYDRKSLQSWFASCDRAKGVTIDTVVFGTTPERLCIYDENAKLDDEKADIEPDLLGKTNFEIQLHGEKLREIGINKIEDLPKLLGLDFLKPVKFVNIFKINEQIPMADYISATQLQILAFAYGYHGAKATVCQTEHQNFSRDYDAAAFDKFFVSNRNVSLEDMIQMNIKSGLDCWFNDRAIPNWKDRTQKKSKIAIRDLMPNLFGQ
jgi:hypothetical protein